MRKCVNVKVSTPSPVEQTVPEKGSAKQHQEPSATEQRTFYISMAALIFSFAAFAFSGLMPSAPLHTHIVTVDVNQLLRQKATALIHTKAMEEEDVKRELQLAEQARNIRSKIEGYAKAHNVMVIAKGACFGAALKDVTDEISATL